MFLQLTPVQTKELVDYAQSIKPNEVCGFIGGKNRQAKLILPITNIAKNPITQFYMEPTEMFRAYKKLERENLDLLAIFHSHPKIHLSLHPPIFKKQKSPMSSTSSSVCNLLSQP